MAKRMDLLGSETAFAVSAEAATLAETVILVLLALGYIINLGKGNNKPSQKVERKCPSCSYRIL
ncbi:MAG: hypothetical protein MKZ83_04555, partial [Candidatus Poseidoniia archaeon]|nr:hypothetical protein [Candidatus Poseidoniia archaeon]